MPHSKLVVLVHLLVVGCTPYTAMLDDIINNQLEQCLHLAAQNRQFEPLSYD